MEVEVDGQRYVGDGMCSSKKEAEQSAAKKAWQTLVADDEDTPSLELSTLQISETYSDEPPSYEQATNTDSNDHLPDEYANIEQFISAKVEASGGRIRKIYPLSLQGQYKFEIGGSYRYCENIRRHHKKNSIYFIVNIVTKTYIQKCHDPQCYGFQSAMKRIGGNEPTNRHVQENNSVTKCSNCSNMINSRNLSHCGSCGKIFCNRCIFECDFCHSAAHCNRCFDACFDCHDS